MLFVCKLKQADRHENWTHRSINTSSAGALQTDQFTVIYYKKIPHKVKSETVKKRRKERGYNLNKQPISFVRKLMMHCF